MRSLLTCLTVAASGCAAQAMDADDGVASTALAVKQVNGCDEVKISTGKVIGKVVGNTREYLGIPYAKAPVGALRFAPPQPAEKWKGVRDATQFGPVCPQPPGALSAPGTQSEDCLNLNVFTPVGVKKDKPNHDGLPVMVFIHGGAFVAGGSTQYDAQKLSELGNAVVVTINYRLGALGFMAHPQLDQTRPANAPSGNDAIRDQQLALKWVQENIGAFGGEPKDVTIFGESAGSMSTCLHMVSPTSRSYGHRFIMESAACTGGLPIVDKSTANALGTTIGEELCAGAVDVIACLRAKPASELITWRANAGISGAGWAPVYNANDPLLPTKPVNLLATGNFNKGSVIIGTNKNEWGLFQAIGLSPQLATIAQYQAAVAAQFGPLTPLVLQQYPVTVDAAANVTFMTLMTDSVFRCPSRALARFAAAHGSKVYLYSFEEGLAFHAFEIPYVFGNPSAVLAPVLVEPLRATVQSYWTSFANNDDPNVIGQPTWPRYTAATDQHMILKAESEVGSGLAQARCDFWEYVASL